MENKEYILQGVTLSTLKDWLTENFRKREDCIVTEFKLGDVIAYVRRGYLPRYVGGNKIETTTLETDDRVKLYNIVKDEE